MLDTSIHGFSFKFTIFVFELQNKKRRSSSKAVGIDPAECQHHFDIQAMLKAKKGKNKISLSDLVHEHLGQPLEKQCQTSDWHFRPLLKRQQTYAATDAWCTLKVWQVLNDLPPESS